MFLSQVKIEKPRPDVAPASAGATTQHHRQTVETLYNKPTALF